MAEVESQLRELIRTRGIDPSKDAASARLLVQEALDDYGERSFAGDLPTIEDPAHAARTLYDSVAGAGPLQRYLDDDSVEEIWIKWRLRGGIGGSRSVLTRHYKRRCRLREASTLGAGLAGRSGRRRATQAEPGATSVIGRAARDARPSPSAAGR